VYATDRGLDELEDRRGAERVTLAWLAGRLRDFVDGHPEHETAVERFATWLARADDEDADADVDDTDDDDDAVLYLQGYQG